MSDAIGWLVGVVVLLIGAWWLAGIARSLLQDHAWHRKWRQLERISPADHRLDPRWGPPFDVATVSHEAWVRGGPIAGMNALVFSQAYPLAPGHGVVAVCAARFRAELPRVEIRRREGVVLPALGLPPIPSGDPHFDQVFAVTGDNPQLVRDLLTPQLRTMLVETRVPVVRIAGNHLLLLEDGTLPTPGPQLDALVSRFELLLTLLPAPLAALR